MAGICSNIPRKQWKGSLSRFCCGDNNNKSSSWLCLSRFSDLQMTSVIDQAQTARCNVSFWCTDEAVYYPQKKLPLSSINASVEEIELLL